MQWEIASMIFGTRGSWSIGKSKMSLSPNSEGQRDTAPNKNNTIEIRPRCHCHNDFLLGSIVEGSMASTIVEPEWKRCGDVGEQSCTSNSTKTARLGTPSIYGAVGLGLPTP
jgi:hypothetical protein